MIAINVLKRGLMIITLIIIVQHPAHALTLNPAHLAVKEPVRAGDTYALTEFVLTSHEPWVSEVVFEENAIIYGRVLNFEPQQLILDAGKQKRTKVNIIIPAGMPSGTWQTRFTATAMSENVPINLSLQGLLDFAVETSEAISRREAVYLMADALSLKPLDVDIFNDINTEDTKDGLIGAAAAVGLVSGYPDGTFKPENMLTRSEAAVLISRLYQLSASGLLQPKDVKKEHWALKEMAAVLEVGYLNTAPDGSFCPDQYIAKTAWTQALARTAENSRINSEQVEENPVEDKKGVNKNIEVEIPLQLDFNVIGF